MLSTIATRKELDEMLSQKTVSDAVKIIGNKPIGLRLYESIKTGKKELRKLSKEISILNNDRIALLRKISEKNSSIIDAFNELFNIINIAVMIGYVMKGLKPEPIYPVGKTSALDIEQVRDINEFIENLPQELHSYASMIADKTGGGYSAIPYGFSLIKTDIQNKLVRTLYGLYHDLLLLKTCSILERTPETLPSLYVVTRDEFTNACSATKDIDNLITMIRSSNPIISGFAEILNDMKRLDRSMIPYDLAVTLYVSNIASKTTAAGLQEAIAKTYVLFVGESMLVRAVLASIEAGTLVSELKEIIDKWWLL